MKCVNVDTFLNWCVLPALDLDLQNRHFNVIIREIDLRSIKVNKNLCFCESGKKPSECHDEIADNTAMSYLFEAFRIIDADINNAVPTPQCAKNCKECCNFSFEVSAAEIFAILRYVQTRFTGVSNDYVETKGTYESSLFQTNSILTYLHFLAIQLSKTSRFRHLLCLWYIGSVRRRSKTLMSSDFLRLLMSRVSKNI
jgi:hypothetical protein